MDALADDDTLILLRETRAVREALHAAIGALRTATLLCDQRAEQIRALRVELRMRMGLETMVEEA